MPCGLRAQQPPDKIVSHMKITRVEAIYLRQPDVRFLCDSGQDALIVRVETDAGITGIGEVDSNPMAAKGAIEGPFSHTTACGLAQVVSAKTHSRPSGSGTKCTAPTSTAGGAASVCTPSAASTWRCGISKGKALGLPVWKLLGGGFHQKIRCYASSLFGATPEQTGDLARRYRDQGFTAVKFGWDPMGQDEKTDIALVREARKGLGDGPDLLIDAGLVWDSKTALQRARAFSEYGIYWLEEPLRPDDYDGYRKLAEATDVRIAAGEEESSRLSFIELMDRGRIDVVQVDLTRCGGFTEAMKIAALAWDRGLPIANHGFTTYINVTAALHWLNSIPNALICEFVAEEETNLRESVTRQKLRAQDGYLEIPQEPGLGIDVDWDAIARFRV